MSFILTLNSTNLSNTNTNTTFRYNFINGGFTCNDYEMCVSSVTLPYSFYNVSSYYSNKTFSLIFPTAGTTIQYDITLPDGFYTVTTINNYIQLECQTRGAYLLDSNGDYVYFVQLAYNTAYYSVQLLTYQVPRLADLGTTYTQPSTGLYSGSGLPTTASTPKFVFASSGSIRNIIGFAAGTYPPTTQTASWNTSSTLTPVGSTVNSIIMQCSLISNRCATPSDIIDSMPINDTSFGSNIIYQPSFERYVTVSNGTFNNFTFSFRDQNLNDIYARDPNVSITLIIRPRR
jgi:hypothetical protein